MLHRPETHTFAYALVKKENYGLGPRYVQFAFFQKAPEVGDEVFVEGDFPELPSDTYLVSEIMTLDNKLFYISLSPQKE